MTGHLRGAALAGAGAEHDRPRRSRLPTGGRRGSPGRVRPPSAPKRERARALRRACRRGARAPTKLRRPGWSPTYPGAVRFLLSILALLASSGCFLADGSRVVRGTVWASDGPGRRPLAGATALLHGCGSGQGSVSTDGRGQYEVRCSFGGICLLGWCPGAEVPDAIEFASPGFAVRPVRLLALEAEESVSRAPCDPSEPRGCFQIDVTLRPEAGR